ncbi:hypothetical protein C8Q80DRAFT_1221806 [Daedaleopsis nitida]|nr:hypothetical protein C8Q80DRAFT_1221806 [Daedaleopsis nitida]
MTSTPSWPSLYNPAVEIFPIENRDPVQPQGKYLQDPHDIFRFTLFWTFVLYAPSFVVCGVYAFLNLSFPPRRLLRKGRRTRPPLNASGSSYKNGEDVPLRRYDRQGLGADIRIRSQSQLRLPARSPAKQNERRSRLTFAVLVFMLFAAVALAGAVVGSAVIGYVLAGLFKAARYNMST